MTVTYTAEVASSSLIGPLKLLFTKWRGSLTKLLWKNILSYVVIYYPLMLTYRHALNESQKKTFEEVISHINFINDRSLIVFVLGFYINIVVSRWWNQITRIPWPDRMAMFVTANVRGQDERGRLMRRTIMRYLCLAYVITMSSISPVVKRRFPSFQHMTDSGLMSQNEQEILEKIQTPHNKYFVPLAWSTSLIQRARAEGRIKDDFAVKTLNDEINEFRGSLGYLFLYDWIPIPLVYTQVVTLVVYLFAFSCMIGCWPGDGGSVTKAFPYPIADFFQFILYMGFLRFAECLLNPFGEDDEDIELNSLIDRNLQVSYLVVDEMHNEHPELIKDQYWDEVQFELPYTEANPPVRRPSHLGSAMKLQFKGLSRQTSKATLSEEGVTNPTFESDLMSNWPKKRSARSRPHSSESTDDSVSIQIIIDKLKSQHRDSVDSTNADGKLTPRQRQDSSCNESTEVDKPDISKAENQDNMKNHVENVKTILEPLMESDEPATRSQHSRDSESF